ncbi:hypothetical protein [Lentzea guizhouensis]|uniref:hypothetical protein n=1 Tax=Lentzea guizhouensis TaxID=1586287 RepID=UPI0012B6823B|nr:hypothetical protein [Lentzea guizhouensis]
MRDLGDVGRVELDPQLVELPRVRRGVAEAVKAAGFDAAELAVFRSGALNLE